MAPGYAVYLENFWCTPTEVEVRKGVTEHATGLPGQVWTLFAFRNRDSTRKLFAGCDTGIFDVTTAGAVGASAATITNGKCNYTNFTTSGSTYLLIVNGTDDMQKYDGSTWTTVATLPKTSGTLSLNTVSNIAAHKRRLWFIQELSTVSWYLPIDSVSGTVNQWDFGGLMTKGGYIVCHGTWTVDGGNGVDDYFVTITSEGQAIIYSGTDPSNVATWSMIGVYDLGKPLGTRPLIKYGGDLLYLGEDGIFVLSKALRGDPSKASEALSDLITAPFVSAAQLYYQNFGWQAVTYPTASALLINIPTVAGVTSVQFAMNTQTGAWTSFTGWDALCWATLGQSLFYGGDGVVNIAWAGSNDLSNQITALAKTAFSYFGGPGLKHIRMQRPMLTITGMSAINVEIDVDFSTGNSYSAPNFSAPSGSLWDSAIWGEAVWSGTSAPRLDWLTAACPPGYAAAARLRSISSDATVKWTSTDLLYEQGALR